ncbi:MAG: SEC-C metal-binding domain-containing protein, partial [Rhodocyclaceae bacterium]|nr:SEC-C metal-binding domain-containing protein [Rhodocyclaceae bacterium]
RFYNEVAATLYRGEEPELILYPVDGESGESDYAAWADGYLYGSHLGQADWLDAAGEYAEDLSDLMEDFFLLNGAIKEDVLKHGEAWMSAAAERQALQQAAEGLPDLVLAVYEFWQALRFPAETLRREAPKVGRNDPCPCGSGRKFKQCCGDAKKLH